MHINEGDGMITNPSTGLVEFIDEDLPGIPGSTVLAEWGNALTFEIKAILEAAGLTLAASAAEDRANDWHQLKTALFDSQALGTSALANLAVTDAKIATVDLAKCFGALNVSGSPGSGVVNNAVLDYLKLLMTSVVTATGDTTTTAITPGNVEVTDKDGAGVSVGTDGLRNLGVSGSPGLKLSVIDLPVSGWSFISGTPDLSTFNGVATGISKTTRIHNMVFSTANTSLDGTSNYDGPIIGFNNGAGSIGTEGQYKHFCRAASRNTSDYWSITVVVEALLNTGDFEDRKLYILHE